jgi:holliday junction DNA helicase RuvA
VIAEDVTALTVIPGVGRKGAQRMVLELRERLGATEASPNGAGAPTASASPRGEAAQALVALGYPPAEAARALDELHARADATAEELLRDALRLIGTRA